MPADPASSSLSPLVDVIVLGAGAAGLFCAAQAGQRGLRVLVIDHSERVAEKIRISGGGRCNFTNQQLDPGQPHRHYVGRNPQFCRSALARYTSTDFIELVQRHGIAFHEKHKGQLFADHSAEDIIAMLLAECDLGGVERWQPCRVGAIRHQPAAEDGSTAAYYTVQTDRGPVQAAQLVVATGGLSIPKIGATDLGYRIAQQFGLPVVERLPGLVPLTFDAQEWSAFSALAGIALPVAIQVGSGKKATVFHEDLLFTHRGLSGPAVLQISNYWRSGEPLTINLLPEVDLAAELLQAKAQSRKRIANVLTQWLPARLADLWVQRQPEWQRPVNEVSDKALQQLAQSLSAWQITPTGTEGYKKAEVTLGGVDTQALSQQTMEARTQRGLYFIGEVVDITGWLGGYNFQWAWASAHACAQALAERHFSG